MFMDAMVNLSLKPLLISTLPGTILHKHNVIVDNLKQHTKHAYSAQYYNNIALITRLTTQYNVINHQFSSD